MGGKGEMGLRLFPINDNTITSRSTTNMLKEFAFFYVSCVKITATFPVLLKLMGVSPCWVSLV